MPLPKYFCWTKFGTEAGEPINNIIQRKEQERTKNRGVFLWGIGNALGPSLLHLLDLVSEPEVLFSPIRSAPKKRDVSPEQVVTWMQGETIKGELYDLPLASLVTSKGPSKGKKAHYALVCESQEELKLNMRGTLVESGKLKNIRTGYPVGYSQVTSIVARGEETSRENAPQYPVAMQVKLVDPYFIKLLNPVKIHDNFDKA